MPNLNPFTRATIPYHRISKEFSENDSDAGQPSSSTSMLNQKENHEDAYTLAKQLRHRRRTSRFRCICSYFLVALLSLLTGLVTSQIFRLEYEVDGFPGTYINVPFQFSSVQFI